MNRYRTILRPAGFGGLPAGVGWVYVETPPGEIYDRRLVSCVPVSRHRYGVVETDRPLTREELEHFDIVEVL
jgi:hypothetical protein